MVQLLVEFRKICINIYTLRQFEKTKDKSTCLKDKSPLRMYICIHMLRWQLTTSNAVMQCPTNHRILFLIVLKGSFLFANVCMHECTRDYQGTGESKYISSNLKMHCE